MSRDIVICKCSGDNVMRSVASKISVLAFLTVAGIIQILCSLLILSQFKTNLKSSNPINHHQDRQVNVKSNMFFRYSQYAVDTAKCQVPLLKPNYENVFNNVTNGEVMIECNNPNHRLVQYNDTHIWIVDENKQYYNTTIHGLRCYYRSFYRSVLINNINSYNIDDRVTVRTRIFFRDITKFKKAEFIKIVCFDVQTIVYKDHLIFAVNKKKDDNDMNMLEWIPTYNVMVIGMSGVPRQKFYRTMPKTAAFMKKFGAVELFGYSSQGEDVFANVIPMLQGVTKEKCLSTCVPTPTSSLDGCPFIWHGFKKNGYYTALAEDIVNGTFNDNANGFAGWPTDYYARTFMYEATNGEASVCLNYRYAFQVLLDYIHQLSDTLDKNKLFGFFWMHTMQMRHNLHQRVIDDSYQRFFNKLNKSKYLGKTIIFFVSDRGIIEENMPERRRVIEELSPFAFVMVPPSFRSSFSHAYQNLRKNSHRLISALDIYATLYDLTQMHDIINTKIVERSFKYNRWQPAISLFLPIPDFRTCEIASINRDWCPCLQTHKLSFENSDVQQMLNHTMQQLNGYLRHHKQCAKLEVEALLNASVTILGTEPNRELELVLKTTPGHAVYAASAMLQDNEWRLITRPVRLSPLTEHNRCMHIYHLKMYCHCLS